MKIVWNDNTIRWFHEASSYTGYNRTLSQILLKHIPHRGTLCDMGCGAALIDFELAPHFEQITCVDISSSAIASVDAVIQDRCISNINTVCMDGTTFTGSFDTVIAIFHGGPNVYEHYYPLAKEQLIIVTHLGKCGTFSPKKHQTSHNYGVPKTMDYLDKLGVKYTYLEENIEFGQPFRSFEDAMSFMDVYGAPGMMEEEKKTHLKSKLINTGQKDFPYYMPNKKQLGIFIINKKENR